MAWSSQETPARTLFSFLFFFADCNFGSSRVQCSVKDLRAEQGKIGAHASMHGWNYVRIENCPKVLVTLLRPRPYIHSRSTLVRPVTSEIHVLIAQQCTTVRS